MFFRILALFLMLPLLAGAQDLPAPLSDTVTDLADLLPPAAEARLVSRLQTARDETGVQIVVVTMDRIANHGGEGAPVEAYAKQLFNAWGVGDATRNDGILILVARDDRVTRIALGSGYDPVYDGRASRVIDTAMLPEFRAGRYAAGIEAGVESTLVRVVAPFNEGRPVTEEIDDDAPVPGMVLFPVGIVLAFLGLIFRRQIGDQIVRVRRCERCQHRGLSRRREVTVPATATAAGSGLVRDHCPACGHDRTETYAIPRRSGSKGGGSSGFGGGRSSGGGATGRW